MGGGGGGATGGIIIIIILFKIEVFNFFLAEMWGFHVERGYIWKENKEEKNQQQKSAKN